MGHCDASEHQTLAKTCTSPKMQIAGKQDDGKPVPLDTT